MSTETMVKKVGEFYRKLVSLELKRRLNESSDIFLLSYHKLNAADMTQLRKSLKAVDANILVAKNSFTRKIFEEINKPAGVASLLDGPMAIVFVKKDPIEVSKVLCHFLKDHEVLQIRGGLLGDKVISLEDIKIISKLGSRQALYQQVASTLNAPMGKLAMCLNQITTKLVYALNAVKNNKS